MRWPVGGIGPIIIVLVTAGSPFALSAQEFDLYLRDGTEVRTKLLQFISSEKSRPADPVHLEVAEDVLVDGIVAIRRGVLVTGTIVEASPMKFPTWSWLGWPRPRVGRLIFTIEATRSVDDQTIQLRSSQVKQGTVGIAVGTTRPTLMRWAHEGIRVAAFVDGEYVVKSQKRR